MERRAIRDRVALERQQVVRDLMIKGDLSTWLDQRLNELQHCQVFYTSQKENVKATRQQLIIVTSHWIKYNFS